MADVKCSVRCWISVTISALVVLVAGFSVQGSESSPGLQTKLTPLEPVYQVGRPMRLQMELVNTGSMPNVVHPLHGVRAV